MKNPLFTKTYTFLVSFSYLKDEHYAHVACVSGNYRWSCGVHVPWNHFRIFCNTYIWYSMISFKVILFRYQKPLIILDADVYCFLDPVCNIFLGCFLLVSSLNDDVANILKRVSEVMLSYNQTHLSLAVRQFVLLSEYKIHLMIKHLNLIFTT